MFIRSKGKVAVASVVIVMATLVLVFSLFALRTSPLTETSDVTKNGTLTVHSLIGLGSGLSLLRTNGTDIVDSYGNIVVLRGVDLTGYEYVPPILYVHPHHESDYAKIASWGFNVVRLPISWANLEPQPGLYNDSYLRNLVDQDVRWATEYHIYLVLDMHQVCWSPHFSFCNGDYSTGIPAWAVTAYPNSDAGEDAFLQDFFSGMGPNGTTPSASNPSMESRFFAAWQHVAERYSNVTTVAGFDILNEPPSSTPVSFYTKAIDAIRVVDPNCICFWETEVQVLRPDVVYAPHYPQDSLTNYNPTSLMADMNHIIDDSRNWNVPIFIGEWGMQADAPGVAQYIRDGLAIFDRYAVSSAWWDYAAGGFTMDLFDANGNARQVLVDNLVRPFVNKLASPINQAVTFRLINSSALYQEVLSASTPTQVLVSIPEGYSIKTIETNSTIQVSSQVIQNGSELLLTFPTADYAISVLYELSS